MKKQVMLHGELALIFGEEPFYFDIRTPGEAIRALAANFKGFLKHIRDSIGRDIVYRVIVDDQDIDESELNNPLSKTVHIVPIIRGAGGHSSWVKIIAGAAIAIAGGYISGWGAPHLGGLITTYGWLMILGGAYEILVPVRKPDAPAEDAKNTPNNVFNGPLQTQAQGEPVSLAFGRLIVGSAVISAGINIQDNSIHEHIVGSN